MPGEGRIADRGADALGGLGRGLAAGAHPPRRHRTGVAGLVYALGPGHNIPFLAGTPATAKGLLLLPVITVVAAIVLVKATARLKTR